MIYSIENDFLFVSVDSFGAQLASIRSKKTNFEYLWQGDKTYWGGRAYNLFPIIGRMYDGVYTYRGETYKMRPHGLIRYYDLALTSQTETELVFTLTHESAEDILSQYPFRFSYSVRFALDGNRLTVSYKVLNLETERDLICAFGGHPGINVPFDGGSFEDYYVEFSAPIPAMQHLLSENKFMDGAITPYYPQGGKRIPLQHSLFDNDALILSSTSGTASIKKSGSNRSVTMHYPNFKYFAVWHAVCTDAPYVCLEPWQALCSTDGTVDDLEDKEDMIHVPPQEESGISFSLEINE